MASKRHLRWIPCAIAVLALTACQNGTGPVNPGPPPPTTFEEPWPEDMSTVWTESFSDGLGDQEALPPEMAGPPYADPVAFPAIDVTEIQLGVRGDFLYMEVRYAGPVPNDIVHVQPDGEIEEQWVTNQGMNIALNTDDDQATGGGGEGVQGIDIFFAVGFDYGVRHNVYANWSFPDSDLHHPEFHMDGELGQGGPGYDFALVRYEISQLPEVFFPIGLEVEIGSWSEAESFDAAGELLYHHFAFDRVIDEGLWFIANGQGDADSRVSSRPNPLGR